MKRIIFLIGSPRKRKSNSEKYMKMLKEYFPASVKPELIYLYETELDEKLFEKVYKADALVMVQPLYVDCIPSRVLEYMRAALEYGKSVESVMPGPGLYFIINCGFLEYNQNNTAIKILENFSGQCGFEFCGGFSIGSGGMIINSRREKILRLIMEELAEELCRKESDEEKEAAIRTITYVDAGIPKFVYKAKSNKLRKILSAKNNLTKKDLKDKYLSRKIFSEEKTSE